MDIHIELPEQFIFENKSTIRIDDINYGGHLSNEAVFKIAHEARVNFLKSHGLSELDAGGTGIIITGAIVEYLAEGFQGDEIVTYIGVKLSGRSSFSMFYRIERLSDQTIIAKVRTDISCFDYSARKVRRIPERLLEAISNVFL